MRFTALAAVLLGLGLLATPKPSIAEALYGLGSSDVLPCRSGKVGSELFPESQGHFNCGSLERMTTAPLSAGYAKIAEVRLVVGEPQVQLSCSRNPRNYDEARQQGAVVTLARPFVPLRRPDIVNTLIRDAMRRLDARCPARPLVGPVFGFVRLLAPATPGGPLITVAEVRNYGLGVWFERTFTPPAQQAADAAAAAPRTARPVFPAPATTAPTGRDLVVIRSRQVRPDKAKAGEVRGRLELSADGRGDFTLIAYSNGAYDGFTDLALSRHQCTQLIVRYAQALGITGVASPRDVGDGKDVARNLAARAGGRFVFVDAARSATLPRPGAVLSISATTVDGAAWTDNPYGHVGIVQGVERISDTEIRIVLFDQNFPLPSGEWKRIVFRKEADLWKGTMTNRVGGVTQTLRVEGWANPVSR